MRFWGQGVRGLRNHNELMPAFHFLFLCFIFDPRCPLSSIFYLLASTPYTLSSIFDLIHVIVYLLFSIFCFLSSVFYPLCSIFYLRSAIFYLLSSIVYLLCSISSKSLIFYLLPSTFDLLSYLFFYLPASEPASQPAPATPTHSYSLWFTWLLSVFTYVRLYLHGFSHGAA